MWFMRNPRPPSHECSVRVLRYIPFQKKSTGNYMKFSETLNTRYCK